MINPRIFFLILLTGLVTCAGDLTNSKNRDIIIQDFEESNIVISDTDYENSDTFDRIAKNNSLSEPYSLVVNGQDIKVKIYSFKPYDSLNTVTFKYCDLINRAIAYKEKNPELEVQIKFAIYKIERDLYIGFNPKHDSYGKVRGYDHGEENSEKLILSLIKAAKLKIHTRLIYHNPADDLGIVDYLQVYMDDLCFESVSEYVRDYFSYKKISWIEGTTYGQQHNKFLLINYHSGNVADYSNSVYISTANVDPHNNYGRPTGREWVQSGILISGNSGLYAAYEHYFEKFWNNNTNRSAFWNAVRYEGEYNHQSESLNYTDDVFSAYFFPIPITFYESSWDTIYNPVAKLINGIKNREYESNLKINMYHLKTDTFGLRLYNELKMINNINIESAIHKDSKNGAKNLFIQFGELYWAAPTHAKNYTISENIPGSKVYYSITGSTNAKWDAYCSKSNNQLVIKEIDNHYIHDIFVENFNYASIGN